MPKLPLRALVAVAAAATVLVAAPRLRAADTLDAAGAGPDMRILTTPQDVLFRVDLGKAGKRFAPQEIRGAMGWSVRLAQGTAENTVWPTPATDGKRVFVGGPLNYSEFYALAARTGRVAWKARLTDNGPTPPVVKNGRVYFNTQSCTLYAYDARTGTRRWSRYLAGHLESIPAVDGGFVATTRPTRHGTRDRSAASTPALTILDLAGRVQADVDVDGEALGAPVLYDGRAYLATRGGTLFCVDVEGGKQLWSRASRARGAPWVDATGVYVAEQDALAAYHPMTGVARWTEAAITPSSGTRRVPVNMAPPALRPVEAASAATDAFWGEGLRPVAVRDRLCIAEGRTLRFFDRITGAETDWWEIDVDEPFAGPPLVMGDMIVVATRGGQVRGVDARHGEIVWAVDLGRPLGSGVIVDDGKLYGVTRDGRLFCVETGDLGADGWPMWGGTPSHAGGEAQ